MRENKLIQFYLTNQCNSKCKTCNIWTNKEVEELEEKYVERVLVDYPNADYVFGGGEFTLYSQKDRLLSYCNSHNINYTILSNCVKPEELECIIAKRGIKNLTISCDGVNHDSIRGIRGNLSNIKSFISNFGYCIDNLKISYTLSKYNEEYIKSDMDMFKDWGINKIYLCIAQDMELLSVGGKSVRPKKNSVGYLYTKYKDMLYDRDKEYLKRYLYNRNTKCTSMSNVHTVFSNGDVVYCQSYRSNLVIGNIKRGTLKDILELCGLSFQAGCTYEDRCGLVCQRRYD